MAATRRRLAMAAVAALALAACDTEDPAAVDDESAEEPGAEETTDEAEEPEETDATEDEAEATDDDEATEDDDNGDDAEGDEESEEDIAASELSGGDDVIAALETSTGYDTALETIDAVGFNETLQSDGPFTVFVPSDAAFGFVPDDTLADWTADQARLSEILSFHVIEGEAINAEDFEDGTTATSMNGAELTLGTGSDGEPTVNAVEIAEPGVEIGNGVLYGIDAVLLPPSG